MTRNAMPQFDSFDPEVLEAARDVAARAGVPLETWIASVVPQHDGEGHRRDRRRPRPEPVSRDVARQEAESRQEARQETRQEARRGTRPEPRQAPRTEARAPAPVADPHGQGIAALMSRLDGLDRALDDGRRAAQDAEARRLQEIEARIERALKGGPAQQVTERLGDIERRMSQLGEQFAAARPPGRRGRPAADEVRDAVQDIRQRQRELSRGTAFGAPADGGIVASMRHDLARRLETRGEDADTTPSATVSELQRETGRLRSTIDQLATSRDVGALEQAVVTLATGVERAQAGTDLTAIAAPIERVRAQVERLAEDVAEDVHTRVADDVRRLAGRLDSVAAAGTAGPDAHALGGLFTELDEIRRLIGGLAGPERIQSLAQGLHAVSAQIAQLQDATGTQAGLRPLLEEIRSDVRGAGPAALAKQIRTMASKVDTLCARADRIDQAAGQAGPADSADMASIHAMLKSLAEKVDRVGSRSGSEGLDALEKQVLTLADRIEAPRVGDPAFAGLERTMDDLLRQVTALREAAPSEAVIERAARSAVAQGLRGSGVSAGDPGEIGLLRASLADMQARQAASDQRLGTTLDGVQSVLDRLVSRLGPSDVRGPSLADRLMSTTGPEAAQGVPGRRSASPRDPVFDVSRASEGLLEPGAVRPGREPQPDMPRPDMPPREPASRRVTRERSREAAGDQIREPARGRALPETGTEADIKTSFIAAARRAAQAAQAELAAEAPAERRDPRARKGAPGTAATGEGRLGKLRAEIDRHRRPLLLGLAAIVLALGALQAINMRQADEAPRPVPVTQAAPAAQPRDEAPREAAKEPSKEGSKEATKEAPRQAVADPQTTQALPNPIPSGGRPAAPKSAVPRVSGMNVLSSDLANLPPGLAKLKQAALDGDGTAIWEVAAREADGRGMPRDLAIAAKLYEKLASAGYAPAQYKVAGHYEKGSGVVKDLAQAKLWYGRAAEQGHARSMHNLAVIYAENPAVGGKPDFASAASWFRQGAEYGIRDSQYNLAVLYARGLGLTQDLVQSYAWFAAAAAQGDDDAGKKRDDVANKLSPADLASAKSLASSFKPRTLDMAVNEPPAPRETVTAPMSLLGAPTPNPTTFTSPARKTL